MLSEVRRGEEVRALPTDRKANTTTTRTMTKPYLARRAHKEAQVAKPCIVRIPLSPGQLVRSCSEAVNREVRWTIRPRDITR